MKTRTVYVVQNLDKPELISVWADPLKAISIAAFDAEDPRTREEMLGWVTKHPYRVKVGKYLVTSQTVLK